MEQVKPWYLSKTIWGVIITLVGFITKTFFNYYIPDISSELVQVIGMGIAIIGRIKAEKFIV